MVSCDRNLPTLRAAVTSQTASQVVITATAYESDERLPADSPLCTTPGARSGPLDRTVPVVLEAPLGTRRLVDGTDSRRHLVLAAVVVPQAGYVPAGFTDKGAHWNEASGAASFGRAYVSSKGEFTIGRKPFSDDDLAFFTPTAPAPDTVHGHPALYQNTNLYWQDGAYLWMISQESYSGTGLVQLDKAMLLKIGNSLR
jgi:hypothetical protein